jgi:hypothetical protein
VYVSYYALKTINCSYWQYRAYRLTGFGLTFLSSEVGAEWLVFLLLIREVWVQISIRRLLTDVFVVILIPSRQIPG